MIALKHSKTDLQKFTMFRNPRNHFSACIWLLWLAKIAIAQPSSESKVEQINSPPIDPGVIGYLSDHLEPRECAQLCTFLALQNINSLSGASKNLKNNWGGGGGRGRTGPFNFPCHHTLKLWNDNVAATEVEGRFDGTEYIENQVIFGLKQVNRKDLAIWLENLRAKKRHSEILQMESEWTERRLNSKSDLSKYSVGNDDEVQSGSGSLKSEDQNNMDKNMTANLNQKIETSSPIDKSFYDEDEEIDIEKDIPSQMYAIIMFAVGGVFCVAIIAITVWCCSRREPHAFRYKPRVSSWTEIDEGQQRLKSGSPDHSSSASLYGLHVDV